MIIDFATLFEQDENIFNQLQNDYNIPYPKSLLEMEQVLILLDLIPECKNFKQELFSLSTNKIDTILNDFSSYNSNISDLSKHQISLLSIYGEKIFSLPYEELNNDLSSQKIDDKLFKKYASYFINNVKLDGSILTHLNDELTEYHQLINKTQEVYNKYVNYKEYYLEGHFQVEIVQKTFDSIKKFNDVCEYLKKQGLEFSYILLSGISDIPTLLNHTVKARFIYNKLIDFTHVTQNYFDQKLIDLTSLNIDDLK